MLEWARSCYETVKIPALVKASDPHITKLQKASLGEQPFMPTKRVKSKWGIEKKMQLNIPQTHCLSIHASIAKHIASPTLQSLGRKVPSRCATTMDLQATAAIYGMNGNTNRLGGMEIHRINANKHMEMYHYTWMNEYK